MIKKFGKSFVQINETIEVPEMIDVRDVDNIYDTCLWVWNKDRDNISKVKIDCLCVGNVSRNRMKSESHQHATLKRDSANWLRSNGNNNIEFEKSYPGGIADVRCAESKIAIECGWTDVEKVIAGIENGWTVGWLCYKGLTILKDYSTVYPIVLFNSTDGISLDSIFRIMTDKEVDKMYRDFLKEKPWQRPA